MLTYLCVDSNAVDVYVSSSVGNDSNSGLTINAPVKSVSKACFIGDQIFLKAGDVFYCSNLNLVNKRISKWGVGKNPLICGFRRPGHLSRWEKVSNNIWKIDLWEESFTGAPNDISDVYCNNIGCIYEYDKDIIHGHKVQFYEELKKNWDIWQTEKYDRKTQSEDFRYIYLYLDKDPNNLSLEFSTGSMAIFAMNTTIERINIIGHGFGISARTKTHISNCKIDIIGGRTFIGAESFCNYGNGIEFYVSSDIKDCVVEDCYISRCYDSGTTIQGKGAGKATPRSIVFRNNLLEYNCQAWEDFLRNDPNVSFDNCRFENNIILNSGNTGFGYPESRRSYCHILGNNIKGPRGMIIKHNIFIGGNFYYSGSYNGEYKSNVWERNLCYIEVGNFVLHDYWSSNKVLITEREQPENINRYRTLTGDLTTKFIVKGSNSIERLANRYKKKYLKKHNY
jgi:hypothetical protein